jgi:hypothetical protein
MWLKRRLKRVFGFVFAGGVVFGMASIAPTRLLLPVFE